MVLGLDEVEDERVASSVLDWMMMFVSGEREIVPWSRSLTPFPMLGFRESDDRRGVFSFVVSCSAMML